MQYYTILCACMCIAGEDNAACALDLPAILTFATGLDSVLAMRFHKDLVLAVDHSDVTGTCPRSSTCDLRLVLPVALCGSYEYFRNKMAFAILNCH